jgi:hypothetical protein
MGLVPFTESCFVKDEDTAQAEKSTQAESKKMSCKVTYQRLINFQLSKIIFA